MANPWPCHVGASLLTKILLIALAGAIGTVSRYGLTRLVQHFTHDGFPWGTFAVNIIGCLLFGTFITLAEHRLEVSEETKTILLVGFFGAFTTFSTFAFDSGRFLWEAQWGLALANVAAHNVIGVACILIGLSLGRLF